jgi:hypothetical protein
MSTPKGEIFIKKVHTQKWSLAKDLKITDEKNPPKRV